jgi:hypothetical protein
MHILLSYPRSGNHMVRFFIELLSESPTFGYLSNEKDVEIYKNKFNHVIPFNISFNKIDKDKCFYKLHSPPNNKGNAKNLNISESSSILLFIIRNPREVLLRHSNYNMNYINNNGGYNSSYEVYFQNIDYFINYQGPKKLFYYEDILNNKPEFIRELYTFLGISNEIKLKYVLNNIEFLFNESKNGKNRSWGGVVSNSCDFYYKKLKGNDKVKFDTYLKTKFENIQYDFIKKKYNLE